MVQTTTSTRHGQLILLLSLLCLISQPSQTASQNLFQRLTKLAGGVGGGKKGNGSSDSPQNDIPTTKLSNGVVFPLIGLGVGNMVPPIIPAMVSHALQDDKRIHMFDTSNVSKSEHLVAKGIIEGVEKLKKSGGLGAGEKLQVHVVTKVWYTHLGYDRTKHAVQSSMEAMREVLDSDSVELSVHVMIHWPRCYDSIPWMNCEQEENALPDEVKQAGPPPHLDKVNAWKGSWKALEDMYTEKTYPIASIGISNFHLKEVEALVELARVQPHIVQTNVWSLLYDPLLVDYCHRRNVHLQAFHLMNGVLMKKDVSPFSFHHMEYVANTLKKDLVAKGDWKEETDLTVGHVLMAWLVQHQVSVIPRTTNLDHLRENSAVEIGKIPELTDQQVKTVAHSVEGLLSGDDLKDDAYIKVTFHAKTKDVFLYWTDEDSGGEIQVSLIEKGTSFEESTHPGHSFRIYDSEETKGDKKSFQLFTVAGNYGDHHHVEL
jgi:diketogulonate reductase-like aldo/keto reductase